MYLGAGSVFNAPQRYDIGTVDTHELPFREHIHYALERNLGYDVLPVVQVETCVVVPSLDVLDGRQRKMDYPVIGLDLDFLAGDAFRLRALDFQGFARLGLGLVFLLYGREGTDAGTEISHRNGIGVDSDIQEKENLLA